MLKETLLKNMKTATSNVLETMFFQHVQIKDNHQHLIDWFPEDQSLLGAKLDFSGPVSGLCYILIPMPVLEELTADFLGIALRKVNKSQITDTIKETLNMIGGNMLSISDRSSVFQLGIPELIGEKEITPEKFGESKRNILFFETDGKRLAMGLDIE